MCAFAQSWAATRRFGGGLNKINKLTSRVAPAPEAGGGGDITKDQFVLATLDGARSQVANFSTFGAHLGRPGPL